VHLLRLVLALVEICLELFVSANAGASTSNAVDPKICRGAGGGVPLLQVPSGTLVSPRYFLVPGSAPFAPPIPPQVPIVHSVIPHQTCILSAVYDIHG